VGLIPSLALAAACIALLVAVQVRHVRTVKAQRRAVLDDVAPLFSDLEIRQDGIGFPSLEGVYAGDRIKVDLIVDTLAMRQLPTLWMLVTVRRRLALDNAVEVLLRPRSVDIVSAGARLPYEHVPPAGWPEDCRVSTAHADAPPYHALVDALPLLHDPHAKALLVAPGGVRLAQELARGDISRHRVVRRAKFDVHLQREHLVALIGVTRDIARDVEVTVELETIVAGGAPPAIDR
jgi:hypothetical protein